MATLATKKVAGQHQTTVLLASDDQEAKKIVTEALAGSDLAVLDAGSLKRARELEAMGFLQISLAATEKISWTGGFGVFHYGLENLPTPVCKAKLYLLHHSRLLKFSKLKCF